MPTDSADTDTALAALATALEEAPQLSGLNTVKPRGIDWAGADAHTELPIGELTVASSDSSDWSKGERVTNDAGELVGHMLQRKIDLRVQVTIHVLSGTPRFPTADSIDLGDDLAVALAEYEQSGHDALLPLPTEGYSADPYGETYGSPATTDAVKVRGVEGGRTADSTGGSGGSARKYEWIQDVHLTATQRINSAEEYGSYEIIEEVLTPAPDDVVGTDTDGEVETNLPY